MARPPEIDHRINGDEGETRDGAGNRGPRRGSGARPIVLLLMATLVGVSLIGSTTSCLTPAGPVVSRTMSSPSGPITITGDADFASQALAHSWLGDGSASHPYIISNYSIDAVGVPTAISVSGTTVHFVIASCLLANATEAGILLIDVANATLWNNTCTSNGWDNIDVISSDDVSISNNSCDSGDHGIHVFTSSSVVISGNTCDVNGEGINVTSSPRTAVLENICFSNVPRGAAMTGGGVTMLWSNHSSVVNNTCLMNQGAGIQLIKSGNTTLTGNGCNMNSGGITVIWDSTYWIANNTCWINSGNGITLTEVNHSMVMNNTCPQNVWIGIDINGNYNIVRNNSCWGGHVGVQISGPGNCTVTGNDAGSTTGYGALINTKPGRGIYVLSSSNNAVGYNLCRNTEGHGIDLSLAQHNTVTGNNCSGTKMYGGSLKLTGTAIYLSGSDNNTITRNTCLDDVWDGILFSSSSDNDVSYNNCSRNLGPGISISNSVGNDFLHNTMYGNGFYIWGSVVRQWITNNIDTTNAVNGRPVYFLVNETSGQVPSDGGQVILANCQNVTVDGGVYANATVGIILGFSRNVTVQNALISGNTVSGIFMTYTSQSRVTECGIYQNPGYGVDVDDTCSANRVWNNTFVDNHGAGSTYNGNHIQANGGAGAVYWNTSGSPHGWGNFWSDWTGPDSDHDGIVDIPYPGVSDQYPLVGEPVMIPEFGFATVTMLVVVFALVVCATRRVFRA